ncbi:hypothetical protein P3S67_030600 [Capsicum chacoense]
MKLYRTTCYIFLSKPFRLQVFLEDTIKETNDIETLKASEKRIKRVVYRAEDRVNSSLRDIILAGGMKNYERACKSFYEELLEVEKEVYLLSKEVMLIEFNKHESKSAELARTSSIGRRIVEENIVVGMKDDFNTILDRLIAQTDELTILSIVGMGGIGKINERHMLLELVSPINRDRTDENDLKKSNDQLAESAYSLKGRRFLIVIDDLSSTEAWDQMQRIFPNDNNKSRILLTTRLNNVADYASPDIPPHDMPFLSFDDSWNLFTKRLFQEEPCPPQLEEIGKHIVQQCRGLPLPIVVVAGLLGKMDAGSDNWKKVEENLTSFFGTVSEQCQAILSLSYRYLPQHLKACFLYIGGFPEDMEIGISKLTSLWIGEQFIKARCDKSLEVVAEEYPDELIDRNLILTSRRRANGRVRTCKIHDLLRQLCIREAQIENSVHVLNDNYCISSEAIHHRLRLMLPVNINWYEFDYLPEHRSGTTSTTRTLVVTSNPSETCVYIPHFKLLKVLYVSSIYQDFSRVISELVHLRYVAANIEEAPSLAKLWNLQTIILHNSTTRDLHLPQEIWTMSEIRHLKIGWKIHMPNPLESESRSIEEQPLFLNNLQTLDLFSSPFVAEILGRTPNLNKLKIRSVSSEWSDFMIRIFLLGCLETLHIYASGSHVNDKGKIILYYFNLAPIDLQREFFPRNLKQLRLEGTNISWEEMVVLANLPNLEVLKAHFGFDGTDWY